MIEAANILERWVRKIVMLGEAEGPSMTSAKTIS
jgi:hypothetical protein